MEGLERLEARLNSIVTMEAMLAAMRTIALSNRQLALSRSRYVALHCDELLKLLAVAAPAAGPLGSLWEPANPSGPILLLVIGSERGLCGAFNETVAARAAKVMNEYVAGGHEVTLAALGYRTERALHRLGLLPVRLGRLSGAALPPFNLADTLLSQWSRAYDAGHIGSVVLVHNVRHGITLAQPETTRLLPPSLPALPEVEPDWPPIIETDPHSLCRRIVRLWLSAMFYGIMLRSAEAEHSVRYQLMEGATQNAERMIDELRMFLQMARQQAITSEMMDLVSGAGLLGFAE